MIKYSFIIPVYNRPQEILELLESMVTLAYDKPFEIVIIEDGSTEDSKKCVAYFREQLNISYYQKQNTGPGDSRNYGMKRAKGEYFIILDSDVILPNNYLNAVDQYLSRTFVHCFGGPDDAHTKFSNLQKAISFSMTSYLTTGGIRGKRGAIDKFQPRSFNMGLSKEAFNATGGFGDIHPGEDPDLTIRLWNLGFETALIEEAKVFHKRRISWRKFYIQVNKFGLVRPILNSWHPKTAKLTYWFPSVFIIGMIASIVLAFFAIWLPLIVLSMYFLVLFISAVFAYSSIAIASMSMLAVFIQFYGYGSGFLKSYYYIHLLKRNPKKQFKKLFFR
ncbi:glycosyltransferase [Aquimarina sp. W85]|uniref:glycosyltransferase n=1 Tax=Aquimarina rhodophyticola TaxID=3342246 RepID=UPI00366D179D